MKYFLGGINGTGKTTFLSNLEYSGFRFNLLKSSAQLFEWLELKPGDYKALRSLSNDFKNEQFSRMMHNEINKVEQNGHDLLVDGHYLNFNDGKPTNVVGSWISRMDALVLLHADSSSIWERIRKDGSRVDRYTTSNAEFLTDKQLIDRIDYYAWKTCQKARSLARRYKKPLLLINNADGCIDASVGQFLCFHDTLTAGANQSVDHANRDLEAYYSR